MSSLLDEGTRSVDLPNDLMQLALDAAESQNLGAARARCDRILAQDPAYADALLWQGALADNYERKLSSLARALELSPDDRRARTLLQWTQSRQDRGEAAYVDAEIEYLSPCLYLGATQDPGSRFGYPCAGNVCHADAPDGGDPREIDEGMQREMCLTAAHLGCPTYGRARARARGQQMSRSPRLKSYFEFFGLSEEPFSIVPMSRFFHATRQHRDVLRDFHQVILHRQGLCVLSAPVGMGKTLTLRRLYEELFVDKEYRVALVPHADFRSEFALMHGMLDALRVRPAKRRSLHDLEDAFTQYVMAEVFVSGRTVVILMDEAHQMRIRALKQLRKLVDYHVGGHQMVQVVLAGQPPLAAKLLRLPALQDRVAAQATLEPLSPTEVKALVWARMREAGARKRIFAPDAIRTITTLTKGHPRRINVLCMHCMWRAHEEKVKVIDHALVQRTVGQVAKESKVDAQPESVSFMERLHLLGQRVGLT